MPKIVVIGARRHRQGIGEFVTRCFHECGAEVAAVVGTREETVQATRRTLAERYDIHCRGYTDVETALGAESPDIVAIASPFPLHLEHLECALRAGAHCLCEKPLAWDPPHGAAETAWQTRARQLVERFVRSGRHLALVTQWPHTLLTYDELYPGVRAEPLERFEMELGPASSGSDMVLDSASHPLSLLDALVGPGTVVDARVRYHAADTRHSGEDHSLKDLEGCDVDFGYRHARGRVESTLRLARCPKPPRPAAYGLNGHRVRRRVELPAYRQLLESSQRQVELPDPLQALVENFLSTVAQGRATDGTSLLAQSDNLEVLVRAAEEAADSLKLKSSGESVAGQPRAVAELARGAATVKETRDKP